MDIVGTMVLGSETVTGTGDSFHAINPAQGLPIEPAFGGATPADLERACALAEAAFDTYRDTTPEQRSAAAARRAARQYNRHSPPDGWRGSPVILDKDAHHAAMVAECLR